MANANGSAGVRSDPVRIASAGRRYAPAMAKAILRVASLALALAVASVAVHGAEVPLVAEADPAPAEVRLTLRECINLALRNNHRLLSARLDREDQRTALWVAEGKFWPDLRIRTSREFARTSADAEWAFADTVTSFEATLRIPTGGQVALVNSIARGTGEDAYNSALTLRFEQPLLKGAGLAANRASVRIARATERMGALAFERAIGDVIAAVARAYRRLVQAHRRVEISSRSLARAQDLLETNRHLIRAGRMAEIAVVEAERDVAERELVLVEAENARDAARLALIDLLDIETNTPLTPAEAALATEGARPDVEPTTELALAHRPEHLAALLRIENAETELQLARNSRRWSLATTFSVDVAGADRHFGDAFGGPLRLADDGDFRAGLELSVPIGDRSLAARVVRARTGLRKAEHDLAELRQSIDIAVQGGVRDVDVRLRQVGLAARAGALAEQALEAERRRLNLGLTTNFRMIVFEDDLVRAQNSELDATIAYLNALTSLDQTLGTTLRTWGIEVEAVEQLGPDE